MLSESVMVILGNRLGIHGKLDFPIEGLPGGARASSGIPLSFQIFVDVVVA